jgi:hypothetical protein
VLVVGTPACRWPGESTGGGFRRGEPIESGVVERIEREAPFRLYYLGRSFAGFPLTHAEGSWSGEATFIYGECEIVDPDGFLGPEGGSCSPPMHVQIIPRRYIAEGCRRVRSRRGVPTVRDGGLILFTGPVLVKLSGRSEAEERRMAAALRSLDGSVAPSEPLPPPQDPVAARTSCW